MQCKAKTRFGKRCKRDAYKDGLCQAHDKTYREVLKGNQRAKKERPAPPDESETTKRLLTTDIKEDIKRLYWIQNVCFIDIKNNIGSVHPSYCTKLNTAAKVTDAIIRAKEILRQREQGGEGLQRVEVAIEYIDPKHPSPPVAEEYSRPVAG